MPLNPTAKQIAARPYIAAWLLAVAGLVFAIVLIGGATRLTDSGLSITDWKPIIGAVPPLSEADWQLAFEKYRQIPEYKLINRGMSLDGFKIIFWWEWAHRFFGRLIGLAFFVPMAALWLSGRLERGLPAKLTALFVLGGLQGLLGWYMVKSGLVDRVDVSQYRLAAHLTLAAIIFACLVWVALGIGSVHQGRFRTGAVVLTGLIIVQIATGGLVAGLDAGMAYNTWPLMDGSLVPDGLFTMSPTWVNLFENVLTVQFQHRVLAYLVAAMVIHEAIASLRHGGRDLRSPAVAMIVAIVVQVALGIWTLIAQVPLSLALLHQAGALVLLVAAVWHAHSTASPMRRG